MLLETSNQKASAMKSMKRVNLSKLNPEAGEKEMIERLITHFRRHGPQIAVDSSTAAMVDEWLRWFPECDLDTEEYPKGFGDSSGTWPAIFAGMVSEPTASKCSSTALALIVWAGADLAIHEDVTRQLVLLAFHEFQGSTKVIKIGEEGASWWLEPTELGGRLLALSGRVEITELDAPGAEGFKMFPDVLD